MNDALQQFRDALIERGIVPPDEIIADGQLHRCDAEGRNGKDDAAYLLHLDGVPAGGCENWRDGKGWLSWRGDVGRAITPAEEEAHRARVEAMRLRRKADADARQHEARESCAHIWNQAAPCDPANPHLYLVKKSVQAHGLKVTGNGRLLVPMHDAAGVLHSLQFINADGTKRFKTGGRKRSCYHAIGTPKGVLCVCEGYATGASIREATGHAVAVALDAGNLLPVAKALRAKFPDVRIVLCADDDWKTKGNPGLSKAREAARAVGGLLAVPSFGDDRDQDMTDFNDLFVLDGKEAVARCIEAAAEPAKEEPVPGGEDVPAGTYGKKVDIIRACDVTPEPISWLWNGWLAAGKMHILGGAPGTGKTTLSLSLAATLTVGGRWPDGTRSPVGNVVIWSGEDDPSDTLVPRLALSGADLSHIYFVSSVLEDGEKRSFDPARDTEPLRRKLAEIGDVKLLVVDPIVSAISGDSHKNAEVRRGLQPLADLAASMRCALLGITHFSKGTGGRDPVERITGSLAFGALARIVLVAAKHQEEGGDEAKRIIARAKSNIGPDDGGFEYDLRQGELKTHPGIFTSCVLWGNAVEGAARDLLATAEAVDDGEGGTLADAKRFLSGLLEDEPLPTKAIRSDADGAGFSWRTIRRAQKELGVEAVREGFGKGGTWLWELPKTHRCPEKSIDAQQNYLNTYGNFGHLCSEPVGHLQGNLSSDDYVEGEI
jgi:putative DNA primase/helicase